MCLKKITNKAETELAQALEGENAKKEKQRPLGRMGGMQLDVQTGHVVVSNQMILALNYLDIALPASFFSFFAYNIIQPNACCGQKEYNDGVECCVKGANGKKVYRIDQDNSPCAEE